MNTTKHGLFLRGSLLSGIAMAFGMGAAPAMAQSANCALVNGVLPTGCSHDNAGLVISRPSPNSARYSGAGDLGDIGFSISIESGETLTRQHIAGEQSATERLAHADRALGKMGLRVTVDGLGARPHLNVTTSDFRRHFKAGERINFRTYSNYPAWIERAEIVILDPRQPTRPVAVVPTLPNTASSWAMPSDGPDEMVYFLRVYDAKGRQDETTPLPLLRSHNDIALSETQQPALGVADIEDRTARRRIPVHGGVVTISGTDMPAGSQLSLMGEPVVPGIRRNFVIQRILPPGAHEIKITADNTDQTQTVVIPYRDIFATGIAEITLGRNNVTGENWRYGRVAGFMDGVFANGTRLTASVDTRDAELRDIFRNPTRRHPDQVLRQIEDRDVWVTMGDDSQTEILAPTSGRFYLRLERDNSYIMWGDFRPEADLNRIVRTDRTLYGAAGRYETLETMQNGAPRANVTAYAAQIDRLTQRDVFRGTGGSAYFLSRRDIEAGTETLIIELRDPVSGRIISSRRLVAGQDYRIDYIQGAVILNQTLSPTTQASGLTTARPLGDYDVNLVVQYDYVPAAGAALTSTYGGRAETWVTPQLRVGVSGSRETTGMADNTLIGGDILLQRHEGTYLSLDVARSEGPGLNSRPSLTGGLDLDPEEAGVGMRGQSARGIRAKGRLDLADIGAEGYVAGWYERRAAGFWSPDYNTTEDQRSYGIEGAVGLGRATLTFGAEEARRSSNRRSQKARFGITTKLSPNLVGEIELAHRTERNLDIAAPSGENGTRSDIAGRLTWDTTETTRLWVFGQATVRRTGDLARDNRIGAGAEIELTETLTVSGEASIGTLGFAGRTDLTWRPNATSTYRVGLREDRTRTNDMSSAARRGISFGADRKINETWAATTETVMGGIRDRRSLVSTYGVTYSPDNVRNYSMGVLTGQTRERDGTTVKREGISFGLAHNNGEAVNYRLRAEYRRDRSDNPARLTRRESWLVSGDLNYQTSDDWRLIAGFDLVLSNGDGVSLRDGRYVEGRVGYAYRPVDNDRLNALFSYTFLDDQPGADQVNIDGNINGPRQRSHILNAAISYDLDERWTLGLKYGFRHREEADRISGTSFKSTAHLAAARVDYRIVHKWDIMGEVRAFHAPRANMTEFGALLGIYREVNPMMRLGIGYLWGGVSDDLRKIERAKSGVFLNLVTKF
jgi:hypothetical protein